MKLLYILIALAVLLLMVVIHEFGHYIAGKVLKFKINEFSIGFGPKIIQKKNKKTGELFSLRLIPLGGYCAFDGETDDDDCQENTEVFEDIDKKEVDTSLQTTQENNELKKFNDQAPWKRIIVLVCGGLFNIISAVIFSFIFILIVGVNQPKISYVAVNEAGQTYNALMVGDVITAVNGKEITIMTSFEDIKIGDTAVFTVRRNGKLIDVTLTKQDIMEQQYVYNGNTETLTAYHGFGFVRENTFSKVSLGYAAKYTLPFTGKMSVAVIKSLGMLVTGKVEITQVTGPIGTIDTIANYTILNWRNLFLLLPLIAANLGIFNLLPIPALDGSKVIFTLIEWIRGKPVNRKIENMIHAVGMLLLFSLVILVDIIGLILRG